MNILFAGGGTGGHVYPALAMAKEFQNDGDSILFVGTKTKIEAKIVPEHGFDIQFIWISGFQRSLKLTNLIFPFKVMVSLIQSFLRIKKFKPDIVIGTGGYVSGPVLFMATVLKIPTMVQEQNSYPGVTNRLLQSRVNEIHIAYENARKYLPKAQKVVLTGNPVRIFKREGTTVNLRKRFHFSQPLTVSILGGSLGSRSINMAIEKLLNETDVLKYVNLIWQTGSVTYEQFKHHQSENRRVQAYFSEMNEIYSVTDIIICRAGAMSLSEIAEVNIPAIIVPYKYAAGNHQLHNANSFVEQKAAFLAEDNEGLFEVLKTHLNTMLNDDKIRVEMGEHMKRLAYPEATKNLVNSAKALVIS